MLCLYLKAPFAVFRTFTAGSFRPTADFITFSAAYGLILNVAGIEMREYEDKLPMTLIKKDLPKFRMALGALKIPWKQSVYQQLHNYPVGSTGKERAHLTKGSKYNITPVRRSFLSGLEAYICMDGDEGLEIQVKDGLNGDLERKYGLPFLGDNNFLIDRLEPVAKHEKAFWYKRIGVDEEGGLKENITRLTISIDRADMSKTRSELFRPTLSDEIPEDAWQEVGY